MMGRSYSPLLGRAIALRASSPESSTIETGYNRSMRVTVGVSGGIAAYKAAELVRALQRQALEVHVVMTAAAGKFVQPLTFAALTGHKVVTSLWDEWDSADADSGASPAQNGIEHIGEAQWADALVVAPATANILAKFAHGIADDFLTTLYLATTAPVLVAPAMNVNMWEHPATQANLVQDAQRALGIVRSHAREWGIDPHRIGVLGFSAGGHLAATLSANSQARTYPRVDESDDASCRPDFQILVYPGGVVERGGYALTPDVAVTAKTPPTFLVMAQDDPVRPENVLGYAMALEGEKVPMELHVYPSGGHGYGLRPTRDFVTSWPQRAADWMRSRGLLGPQ